MRSRIRNHILALCGALGVAACGGSSAPQPAAPALDIPKLGATPVHDPPGSVRFARQPARVGDHFHTLVHLRNTTTTGLNGGPDTLRYDSEFDETVLAVDGPTASRLAVSFVSNTFKRDIQIRTSIHGKDYVVDVHAPNVIDAATKAPPASDEITRVLDVEPDLGTRAPLAQIMPERPLAVGDHVDDLAGAIGRIYHPRDWRLDHGVAVVSTVAVDEADFDVQIEATNTQSGMTCALHGRVRLRAHDTQLSSFELEGTCTDTDGVKSVFQAERHTVDILASDP